MRKEEKEREKKQMLSNGKMRHFLYPYAFSSRSNMFLILKNIAHHP